MLVDPSILQFHHTQLIMETITYGDRVIKKNNMERQRKRIIETFHSLRSQKNTVTSTPSES